MKVLLVEDEKGVASFIKKGLEEERYTVEHVEDGQSGYEYALNGKYDLIILDVMLPRMDGFEVCRKLRQEGVKSPVLMLTAKIEVKDKVQGLDSGADDYLTKPFAFDEFLARVRALMRRKQEVQLELNIRDLELNTQSHRVYIGKEELILRPKEYSILEYLVRNKDCVVSRTQLLENIWGYDFDPSTNVVDVHIKAIRKKIEEITEVDYIRTVRGVGYMITES